MSAGRGWHWPIKRWGRQQRWSSHMAMANNLQEPWFYKECTPNNKRNKSTANYKKLQVSLLFYFIFILAFFKFVLKCLGLHDWFSSQLIPVQLLQNFLQFFRTRLLLWEKIFPFPLLTVWWLQNGQQTSVGLNMMFAVFPDLLVLLTSSQPKDRI